MGESSGLAISIEMFHSGVSNRIKRSWGMKKVKKSKKTTPWMGAYKFALWGVVVMTVVAIGAMVAQYWTFKANEWMYADPEIDQIDFERKEGLPVCGESEETKGGCVNQPLSTPTSGASCQTMNPAGAKPGVTEAGCRAMAIQLRSWAGAFRSDACQSGLMFDQKTITSDMLVDKVNKTMKPKPISIAGMHKCAPGLAGRKCPVGMKYAGKATKWEDCYTVALKGACKYGTEQPINIVSGRKMYKYCAPIGTGEVTLEGGTGCYTGSAQKPTVKLCCPAGKTAVSGVCQ